ncbi:MAG: GAF domain-containing sensor histidine kinase [Oscillochloridaceae bacterium umkhey_bin13]
MKATTTAPNPPAVAEPRISRWKILGGERFYAFARWVMIMLLFAVTLFLTEEPLWPISRESHPLTIILWAYTGFTLLASLIAFIPQVAPFLGQSYLADLAFISLMTFFGGEATVIFFPLYLPPLIYAAVRQSPGMSLGSGVVASVFYITAFLAWRRIIVPEIELQPLDYMAVGLRGVTLSFLPWVTSVLAERWSETNRANVIAARQDAEQALNDARAYRDQMRSLYEVAYTLSTTVDYRQVLEATLHESRKLVPYNTGFVLLSSGQPDELYVAASESLSIADQTRRITVAHGLATALRGGEAQVLANPAHDPDLQGFESLQASRSACLIPLRATLRTYGLMVVASDANSSFTPQQIENLTALANYAIIALHNAQLIFDLKEERNKLISKEEVVRHQLARDLHDGPAQALAALTMNIEFVKRLLERDPSRVIEELDKMSALAKRTTYEVRTMLFELRPLVLETQGLRVTLEQYLERFKGNNAGTAIVLEAEGMEDVHLETKTEGTLFNIIQEAVNNALKHARAQEIRVTLTREGKMLHTVVKDNGLGFDLQEVLRSYEKRGSFGLLNIDERARLVGGNATIESAVGQGTKVTIVVPIEQ